MKTKLYEGKSKVIYQGPTEDSCLVVFKNTATAFNGEKKAELSGKAQLNAAISNFIFGYLQDKGFQTHLLKVVDETSVLARKVEVIQVEVIVRNVAAGSFSKKFGVAEGTALCNTVLEFCYKSDALGDPMMNESQITAIGLATQEELSVLARQTLAINECLCALFAKAGIRLVDFKLEFGRCGAEILLCDEISPDSCRLWDMDTEKKLDKDRFRRDLGDVMEGYQEVLQRLRDIKE